MGVGMFIQTMTLTGVRGYIVVNSLSLPSAMLFVAMAITIPLFGAVSSYGAASVLGVPFLMAFLSYNQIITGSAISFIAALGDLMPPTALAGIFAAQIVGMEKYTPVLKPPPPPCLLVCLLFHHLISLYILLASISSWSPLISSSYLSLSS